MGKTETVDSLKEKLEEWKRLRKEKRDLERQQVSTRFKTGTSADEKLGNSKMVSKLGTKKENEVPAGPLCNSSRQIKGTSRGDFWSNKQLMSSKVQSTAAKLKAKTLEDRKPFHRYSVPATLVVGHRVQEFERKPLTSVRPNVAEKKTNGFSMSHRMDRKRLYKSSETNTSVSNSALKTSSVRKDPVLGITKASKRNIDFKTVPTPAKHQVALKKSSDTSRKQSNFVISKISKYNENSRSINTSSTRSRRLSSNHRRQSISSRRQSVSNRRLSTSKRKSGVHFGEAVTTCTNQITIKPKVETPACSMRQRLNGWLKSKGKTPSGFRHLMCFDAEMSTVKSNSECQVKRALTVDELTQQQETLQKENVNVTAELEEDMASQASIEDGLCLVPNIDKMDEQLQTYLNECLTLFEAGCPQSDILSWLSSIEENIPIARERVEFYACKIKVLRSDEKNTTDDVLSVFEESIKHSAKPAHALATMITRTVKDMISNPVAPQTLMFPALTTTPFNSAVKPKNVFQSSSVKFCLKDLTALKKRGCRSIEGINMDAPHCVVTPVRRSTRRSLATLPEALQDKQQIYDNLADISKADLQYALYQENKAINMEN
ncbi:hypothetical protein ScPMuIL_010567 [Solemya velum]